MEEQKQEETANVKAKKKSLMDKIISNSIIPLAILSVGYLVNTSVCAHMRDYHFNQMSKTPAYQEFVKVSKEVDDLNIINKTYSSYLSEEGKKALEQRVAVLTEKKNQLIPELEPYEEKANKWVQRGVNPLEYFK